MMSQPLAERLRPKTLDDYIGQKHPVGQGAVLRKMIDAGRVPSFILWGPPGVGKTTLAQIIANKLGAPFLYVKCDQFGSEGRAGGDREGQEQPLLQYGIADIVY